LSILARDQNRAGQTAPKKGGQVVNSILSFRHNDKHETQHVGQLISVKGSVPFYAYQPDIYFLVAEGPMLLSRVTAHKINTFRCIYLATMATSGDDDDDEDGATTITTMLMATARQATGYNNDGGGRRRQRGRWQRRDGRR